MNMRDDSSTSNRRLNQSVEFLVSSDRKMKMAGSDSLHFQILRGIASQLEHLIPYYIIISYINDNRFLNQLKSRSDLSGKILKDGSRIDGGSRSDTTVRCGPLLEESMDSSHRELESRSSRTGDHLNRLPIISLRNGLGMVIGKGWVPHLRLGLARVLACLSLASSHFVALLKK